MSNLFNSQFRRGPPARAHHHRLAKPKDGSASAFMHTVQANHPSRAAGFPTATQQIWKSRSRDKFKYRAHSREREANSQRRHTLGSTLGHMSVCNEHNIIGRNKSFASASRRACPCGPMRAEREREKERESTALRRAFGPGAEGLSTGFTLSVSPQPDSPLSCPQAFVAAT